MKTINYKGEEVLNNELLEASRNLMKLLSDLHPHYTAIVTANTCEKCGWIQEQPDTYPQNVFQGAI